MTTVAELRTALNDHDDDDVVVGVEGLSITKPAIDLPAPALSIPVADANAPVAPVEVVEEAPVADLPKGVQA